MRIRALLETDDRSTFESGDPDLDRFFRRFAGQNQFRHLVGVTYVAVDGERIVGFVTVAPGQMEIEDLPDGDRKGLPRYPAPILRLARLAVAAESKGSGIGVELLRFVLALAVRLSRELGCVGVLVDAKAGAASFYERYGFVRVDLFEGASDERPRPIPLFLAVRKIEDAIR